ncbi:MAG: hypothetical protein ABUT20_10330 [Bacteroidota bacterium]
MRRNFIPDQTLVDRLLLNDTEAFEELYHRHWYSLYSYSISKLKSAEDSKTIVKNVFCSLWKNREFLPLNFSLSTYLYTEVRNAVLKCVNSKIESMAEDFYIEKQIIPGFTSKELYKARRPVSHINIYPKPGRLRLTGVESTQSQSESESWLEKSYSRIHFKGLKNALQTMMNF